MKILEAIKIRRKRKRLQNYSRQISIYAYSDVPNDERSAPTNVGTNLHALTDKIRGDE